MSIRDDELQKLVDRIRRLDQRYCLRTPVSAAVEIGDALLDLKQRIHARRQMWIPFLRETLGLKPRRSQLYMQVARAARGLPEAQLNARVTLEQFLGLIRKGKRLLRREERDQYRQRIADLGRDATAPDRVS